MAKCCLWSISHLPSQLISTPGPLVSADRSSELPSQLISTPDPLVSADRSSQQPSQVISTPDPLVSADRSIYHLIGHHTVVETCIRLTLSFVLELGLRLH